MHPPITLRSLLRTAVVALCCATLVLAGPAAFAQGKSGENGNGQGNGQSAEAPGQAKKDEGPGQAKQDEGPGQAKKDEGPGQAKQDEAPGQAKKDEAPAQPTQGKQDEAPGQVKKDEAPAPAQQAPGQVKKDEAPAPAQQAPGQVKKDEGAAQPRGAAQSTKQAEAAGPQRSTARPAGRQEAKTSSTAGGKAAADRAHRGNAGSIKVNPVGWTDDEDNPPRNHPHVGCEFDVNFYGFYGSIEDVSFVAHPPSGRFVELPVQAQAVWQYDVSPPPGNTLVETQRWDLEEALTTDPEVTEHHKQGYHVKVTAESDREGPGNRKHKVFWVRCDGETVAAQVQVPAGPAEQPAAVAGRPTPAPVLPEAPAALPEPQVGASSVAIDQQPPVVALPEAPDDEVAAVSVLGAQVTAPVDSVVVTAGAVTGQVAAPDAAVAQAPVAQAAPGALAATGAGVIVQLVAGLLLIAGGAGLRRRSARR